jgi:2',3'-cyclic-nucleotide 2'-phosphodiesterase (5'-nucleotidase family)
MADPLRLTILHTNDLHGRLHRFTRIVTLIRRIRQEVADLGGHSLYLDAGDTEDSTLLESVLSRGAFMNSMLRAAGCDQVALGNAIPIRYGPQAVANQAEYLGKPLLCANLITPEGALLPGVVPYQLVTIEDLSLAIIGFTAPMDFYTTFFKYPVYQPVDLMPALIEKARVDGAKTILALTHIASKQDIQLAESVSGIDLIVGGHDHQRISPPMRVNDTLIAQSGQFGESLGRLDLVIDRSTGRILEHTGMLIPVTEDIPEDEQMLQAIASEKKRIDVVLNETIGEVNVPLSLSEDAECAAGNLQADAVLDHMKGAQLAFMVNGHWVSGLEAGKITQRQLYGANRSAGNPTLVELSGAQIRQWLIAALKPENITSQPIPLRGMCVGMPGIAGMNVIADPARLEALQVFVDGEPMDDTKTYLAATTDMEISTILDYLAVPFNEVDFEVPIVLPEIIEEYIRKHSPIQDVKMGRIILK